MVTVLWTRRGCGAVEAAEIPSRPACTAFGIEQDHHPSNTDISSSFSQPPTFDRYTMEGATESPFNSQADNEIETYENSDAEMEIEEDPEEIELNSYITDEVHVR